MSDLAWLIYLANVLPNIQIALVLFGLFGGAVSFITLMLLTLEALDEIETEDRINKYIKLRNKSAMLLISCFVAIFVSCFIPSQRTIYLMAGVSVVDEAVDTEEFDKVRRIINNKLDEYIVEEQGETE